MADLSNWKLQHAAQLKTAEAWGIDDFRFAFISGGADQCIFALPSVPFDDPRVFPYGATLTIFKITEAGATIQWFKGEVIKPRAKGGATSEFQQYTVVGIWFALQETTYQQQWGYFIGKDGVLQRDYTSHIELNGTEDGLSLVTTQAQILLVLNYALAQLGATFQIGGVSLSQLYPPVEEITDMPAAEVILRQLRYHPEAAEWLDYTTDPPSLYIRRYDELAAVELAYGEAISDVEAYVDDVELDSREDLKRPCVAIKYEVRTTVDGRDRLQLLRDVYPLDKTGRERGALAATVKLSGGKRTSLSAEIVSQEIPEDLKADTSLDWWKEKFPESLGDSRVSGIVIVETGRILVNPDGTKTTIDGVNAIGLPFELVAGQIPPWMPGVAQREEITIKCRFQQYDGDPANPNTTLRAVPDDKIFTRAITTTDIPSDIYYGGEDIEEFGDLIPVGLAQALYQQLQILHYSGTFKLIEKELSGRVRPGMVVNVVGGRPEWATMRAMVQQVEETASSGETAITVGPPEHLTAQNILELLKVNRFRQRSSIPGARATGEIDGATEGALGKHGANADRAPGGEMYQLMVIKAGAKLITIDGQSGIIRMTEANVGTIELELAKCATRTLKIQETGMCETVAGVKVTKHALVLRSDTY